MNLRKHAIQPIGLLNNTKRKTFYRILMIAILGLLVGCNNNRDRFLQEAWQQVFLPGPVENFLGVSIVDNVCYLPEEIDYYVLLRDKTVYRCIVGKSCIESSVPESIKTNKSGGLGTFCSFEIVPTQGDAPNPLPEGHGTIQSLLHVSGGERIWMEYFYVIFEDGTLWWKRRSG